MSDARISSMSLEEKVSHVLMPEDRGYGPDDWKRIMDQVPLANAFVQTRDARRMEENIRAIQAHAGRPLLIAADMENGYTAGTLFPRNMAIGATEAAEFARRKGQALARECRAAGIHWCFNPVVDLPLEFRNPETSTRAYGDDPGLVARLATAHIAGVQEKFVAATAKHFPGAGTDDRDQHLCTSRNSLDVPEWWRIFGAVWRRVIDTGVMTVMTGHICFPAYQEPSDDPAGPMPATLSYELQCTLLREELGFGGVIVSDALPMVGISSRCSSDRIAVEFLKAGGDMLLFADPLRDHERICMAVWDGELDVCRLDESVGRVLWLRQQLRVEEEPFGQAVSDGEASRHQQWSSEIAASAVTIMRDDGAVGAPPPVGGRVVTATITNANNRKEDDLSTVDMELQSRGYTVEHLRNPTHNELADAARRADHLYLNLVVNMHTFMGVTRLVENAAMALWRGWWVDFPRKVTVTSFGSPHHLYEVPSLPNMLLCYAECPSSQRAAVRTWLGEIEPSGRCPVRLPD